MCNPRVQFRRSPDEPHRDCNKEVVETFVGLALEGDSGWLESEGDFENLITAFLDWADGNLTEEERSGAADDIEKSAALTDDEFVAGALITTADALRE